MSIDRVGEHAEAVWKPVMVMPSLARRSKVGVGISLPYGPVSLKPRSSATMIRKLGRLFGILHLVQIARSVITVYRTYLGVRERFV